MKTQSKPSISAVIPTYNRAEYVSEAIQSILDQTQSIDEIIVIDDGSTDNTEQVIKKFGSRIQYVKQSNAGPSAARNHGMRLATSELIAFLDSDDLWIPTKTEKQLAFLQEHPNVDFVFGDLVEMRDHVDLNVEIQDSWLRNYLEAHSDNLERFSEMLIKKGFSLTPTLIFRRSCLKTCGYFDESLQICEDLDLWLRAAENFTFGFVNETLARRRRHDDNLVNDWSGRVTSRLRVLENLKAKHSDNQNFDRHISRSISELNYDLGSWYLKRKRAKESIPHLSAAKGVYNSKRIAKILVAKILSRLI